MPKFEITGYTGTYHVDAPDETSALNAFAALHAGSATAPALQGSSLGGVAKSLGTGLAQGVIGLAGLPGDVGQLASNMGGKLRDVPASDDSSGMGRFLKFMRDESARSTKSGIGAVGSGDLPGSYIPPTSDQLQKSDEGVTGQFYKPQGAAE